ncbi:MAG: molybdenum cofactor carrier [Planctomycetales bacterium]|nr:molybdenum cofactor carrier [Planctomycetales bacterium]NIM09275.1 molybdenum cofactor carrier [Planctomycetales bacterium]NIN08743.1 molybdenum cofactor carrier [Planctomycetales bacterium]NIN77862.1 molybdenum cofactor carrier [Planctomycetales bacterium]NIO35045.1 molybdenum cofactor carrier [Planctomycetales bacterium]
MPVRKIVSGGQTGVDRGALDAAIAAGIRHGGWCPQGRRAEDGVIPRGYRLKTTESADYKVRTERNVIDSDATLILCRGPLSGGSLLTRNMATACGQPLLVIDLKQASRKPHSGVDEVVTWLSDHKVRVLNVAGPRESQQPGIAAESKAFLLCVLNRAGD